MARGIHPLLNVSDLDRSFAFYKSLGLRARVESMPMGPDAVMRWVVVESGPDHTILIMGRDFEGADPEDVAWASGEVGKGVLLHVGVPDARKVFEKAKAAGVPVEDGLRENPWGGRALMVADPDGYYLMITDKFPPSRAPGAKKAGARKGAAKKGAKKGAKGSSKGALKRSAKKGARRAR